MALFDGAGFKDIAFNDCKMLGLNFTVCNTFMFTVSFEKCILDYSTFLGMKVKKTSFISCILKEADFSQADLSGSVFRDCDLTGTTFSATILDKVDFRTAQNFSIDPAANKMKKAKFSNNNLSGLLYRYDLDIDYRG